MIKFNVPPYIEGTDKYVLEVMQSGEIAGDNKYTKLDEEILAKKFGSLKVHLTTSGTSALEMACMLVDIGPGDEVIVPSYTFSSTANAIVIFGGTPVFVDIDPKTMNINADLIEDAITDKTKAIMVVHYAGVGCDMEKISDIAKRHNLYLLEDAAQVVNATYHGKYLGTFGDVGCYSFHETKNYSMGEGGAVYTNNPLLHRIVRSFRDWGRDCICPPGCDNFCGHRFDKQYGQLPLGYDHKYVYSHFGYNLKATDMQAAVGCAQLKKFPSFVEKRRHNFAYLKELLSDCADKLILPEAAAHSNPSWFGFLMTCKEGVDRTKVVNYIESHGVQTRMLFSGNLIKHPCFDQIRGTEAYRVVGGLENTDFIMNNTFWVGVYPGMTDAKLAYMAKVILEAVNV